VTDEQPPDGPDDPDGPDGASVAVSCVVNGAAVDAGVEPRRTLADFLRDELALTGTHLGCEHGVCGACTVLVDGRAVRSCLMLAVQADGRAITTIEGLADGDRLHPVQQAMHDTHGFQCAFCAPGFLMTTLALLESNPDPTTEEIRAELSGNLCRCTGYHTILAGVERAVELMKEDR
jgi:carbon-monoxide dehydrogenase small subunit